MTQEQLIKNLIRLADAIYDAGQHLTTDASQLHKAMEDYHQFVINNLEPTTLKVYWPHQKDAKGDGLVSSNGRIIF